jgi:predicted acylesterase/phospholipase RssA
VDDQYDTIIGDDGYGNVAISGHGNKVTVIIYEAAGRRDVTPPPTTPPSATAGPEIGPNPYRSLSAFDEVDTEYFFGREEITRKLWFRFQELSQAAPDGRHLARVLPIIGPSGCGKSSLARAGLIPELVKRPISSFNSMRIGVCTPGVHPIEALATVLARIDAPDDDAPAKKIREFREEIELKNSRGIYDGLRRVVDALPEINRRPMILLIDQLEELYSVCDDSEERNIFIENLLVASKDPNARLSVIITLRSDFLGALRNNPELDYVISGNSVLVPGMTEYELRDCITKPAQLCGFQLDPSTVELLITESRGREGALPLLQFALTRIWEGLRTGKEPTVTLQELGGVGGALASEADQLLADLRSEGKERVVRRAFLKMVRRGEGTQDTRRRAHLSEIVAANEDPQTVLSILRRFSQPGQRLITFSKDGEDVTVEITHEQLIYRWPTLRGWLADSEETERFRTTLAEAALDWAHGLGELWRGANLRRLKELSNQIRDDISPAELRFWESSVLAAKRRFLVSGVASFLLLIGVISGIIAYATTIISAGATRNLWAGNVTLAAGTANAPQVPSIGPDPNAPLIFMAFSGGGSRAAAFALGVLDQLAVLTYPAAGKEVPLINDVKVVSSVSGGSVVAAWFGLVGPARLDELNERFLAYDNVRTLERLEVWNPAKWAKLAFTDYTRIGTLRDLLDLRLFNGARFSDLRRPDAPLILINSTDIASGEVFPFTPQRFDDICSDFNQLPISVAVAASVAMPIEFSPVTLRNYSYEDCQGAIPGGGWITAELTLPLPRYINLHEFKLARYTNALRDGKDAHINEPYIHLLDGGLADNLALTSLTQLLASPHSPARILDAINAGRAKRMVLISVNARSDLARDMGARPTFSESPEMLANVVSAASDITNAQAILQLDDFVRTLAIAGSGSTRVYKIAIDFAQFLPDQRELEMELRHAGTSWSLEPAQLQRTIDAGKKLLQQHPCFQRLLLDLNARGANVGAPNVVRRSCPFEEDKTG